jgi:antitoxin CptB
MRESEQALMHGRLLWRCRRGMKELDVLLDRFARHELPWVSPEQRRAFARFLELADPLMADYLLGHAVPGDAELAGIVPLITGCAIGHTGWSDAT